MTCENAGTVTVVLSLFFGEGGCAHGGATWQSFPYVNVDCTVVVLEDDLANWKLNPSDTCTSAVTSTSFGKDAFNVVFAVSVKAVGGVVHLFLACSLYTRTVGHGGCEPHGHGSGSLLAARDCG